MLLASDQVYIATMNPTPVSGPFIEKIPLLFNKRMDPESLYVIFYPQPPYTFVVDLGGAIPVNTLGLSKFCLSKNVSIWQEPKRFVFSLVQGDPWNDGGTKDFKLLIATSEGGPFTEV